MPTRPVNPTGYRLLFALALIATTWLGLTPSPVELSDVPFGDKWGHLAAYFVLAWLIDFSWPTQGFSPPKWLALVAYGVAIELLQSLVPGRMLSIADVIANCAGLLLYGVLALPFLRQLGWRQTP